MTRERKIEEMLKFLTTKKRSADKAAKDLYQIVKYIEEYELPGSFLDRTKPGR